MFQVKLLDKLQIELDGSPIDTIVGIRSQAIFALLVMTPDTPIQRTELAGSLWPDSSEKQARTNLRREIHALKQHNEQFSACIVTQRNAIQWCMPDNWQVDVIVFEAAVRQFFSESDISSRIAIGATAVEIYQGELLPHLSGSVIQEKRDNLAADWLRLCDELISLLALNGDYERAVLLANRALCQEPLKESLYLQLMHIYLASDNDALAVQTYQRCAHQLRSDLGITPNSSLTSLLRKIRPEDSFDSNSEFDETIRNPCADLFVGRQQIRKKLSSIINSQRNPIILTVVSGEAGIGKTRLVEEVVRTTVPACNVAYARCYPGADRFSCSPFLQWMKSDLFQSLFSTTEPFWQAEIISDFPELQSDCYSGLSASTAQSGNRSRHRLFEALCKVVSTTIPASIGVHTHPLALVIDDIQWCDKDFIDFLIYLCHHSSDVSHPIRIIVTQRVESITAEHPLNSLTRQLVISRQLVQIPLEKFSDADSMQLARSIINSPAASNGMAEQLSKICQWACGNPFYIVEAVKYWCNVNTSSDHGTSHGDFSIPPRIDALIHERVQELCAAAQHVLQSASAIGRQVSVRSLKIVCELPSGQLAQITDLLWQKRFLKTTENGDYEFSHDCIREAIYTALLPAQRQELHGKVAAALEETYVVSLDGVCRHIGLHWRLANRADKAFHWNLRALEYAEHRLASRETTTLADECLKLLEHARIGDQFHDLRIDILVAKSHAVSISEGFGSDDELPILSELEASIQNTIDARRVFRVLGRLRLHASFSCKMNRALRLAQRQLTIATSIEDPILLIEVHRSLAFVHFQWGHFTNMADVSGTGITHTLKDNQSRECDGDSAGPSWNVAMLRALHVYGLLMTGSTDAARDAFAMCWDYELCKGDALARGLVSLWIGCIHLLLCDFDSADAVGHKMMLQGEAHDLQKIVLMGEYIRGCAALNRNEVTRAVQYIENAVSRIELFEEFMPAVTWYPDLADAYRRAGRVREALLVLEKAKTASRKSGIQTTESKRHCVLAQVLADTDADIKRVTNEFRMAVEIASKDNAVIYHLQALAAEYEYRASRGLPLRKTALRIKSLHRKFHNNGDSVDLQHAMSALAREPTVMR